MCLSTLKCRSRLQVVIIDEIGTGKEVSAAKSIAHRGVVLVGEDVSPGSCRPGQAWLLPQQHAPPQGCPRHMPLLLAAWPLLDAGWHGSWPHAGGTDAQWGAERPGGC